MNYRYTVVIYDRYWNLVEFYHLSRSNIESIVYDVIAHVKAKYNAHFELIEDHLNNKIVVRLL